MPDDLLLASDILSVQADCEHDCRLCRHWTKSGYVHRGGCACLERIPVKEGDPESESIVGFRLSRQPDPSDQNYQRYVDGEMSVFELMPLVCTNPKVMNAPWAFGFWGDADGPGTEAVKQILQMEMMDYLRHPEDYEIEDPEDRQTPRRCNPRKDPNRQYAKNTRGKKGRRYKRR